MTFFLVSENSTIFHHNFSCCQSAQPNVRLADCFPMFFLFDNGVPQSLPRSGGFHDIFLAVCFFKAMLFPSFFSPDFCSRGGGSILLQAAAKAQALQRRMSEDNVVASWPFPGRLGVQAGRHQVDMFVYSIITVYIYIYCIKNMFAHYIMCCSFQNNVDQCVATR